jgi:hypothetical protein
MFIFIVSMFVVLASGYAPTPPCDGRVDGGYLPCDNPCSSCYSAVPYVTAGEIIYGDQLLQPSNGRIINFERWPDGEDFEVTDATGVDASVVFGALNAVEEARMPKLTTTSASQEFSATSEAASRPSWHFPLAIAAAACLTVVLTVGAAALRRKHQSISTRIINATPMISSL